MFETVRPDRQIVAVGLQVEQDAGPLIDAAGDAFETHRDVSIAEILHILRDGIREIRIGLHAVEKLGVALAVERPRLVDDSGGGLPFLPLPSINGQHLAFALIFNPPDANDAHERTSRFSARRRLKTLSSWAAVLHCGQDQGYEPTGCDAESPEALTDLHG
jgi:hypothetical protein